MMALAPRWLARTRAGTECQSPAVRGKRRCRKHASGFKDRTCSSHGGHKKVRQGSAHWNFRGAGQTQSEREERQMMAVFFHEVEDLMHKLDMVAPGSTRTRRRKPSSRIAS